MKNTIRIAVSLLVCCMLACDNMDTDFQDFLKDGEMVYPGVVSHVYSSPGNLRTALSWRPSPDPSISRYVIYWNNRNDSLEVEASSHSPADTITTVINDLKEYVYSFTIYSYDAKGNRSVPLEVNNVRVYGPIYTANLLNRPYAADDPYVANPDGSVLLNFSSPDTINISTLIEYTNTDDAPAEKQLLPGDASMVLDDYKEGSVIRYRSSYIPVEGAIDTFYVAQYDTFPRYVQLDKSLFSEVYLPNDVGTYESGTSISKLWDGSEGPQGYPNIFHSDGGHPLPHHFTFDLGAVYDHLSKLEETGRDCCNNPDAFEVWGIDDLTGAETTLPGNDTGWKDEAVAKGWTLLAEALRSDDGKAPFRIDVIANPPPVRYIRIRILHVTTGDGSYSNMSELTFWNKE